MKIEPETSYDLDDLLLKPQHSTINSRKDVNIEREFLFYHSPKSLKVIPLICSNMTSVGQIQMARDLSQYKIITCLHKYYTQEKLLNELPSMNLDYTWLTIGMKENELEQLIELEQKLGKSINICVDVASGHTEKFIHYCAKVRKTFPQSIIMAGNVSISDSVKNLIINGGIDLVKIFTGPGKSCRTRKNVGVGIGTASCIMDCAFAAHGLTSKPKHLGLVCADGGFRYNGDVCKALALGSDFICSGSLFAATDSCNESEWLENPRRMKYYGMSSHKAQEKWSEGKKEYRASEGAELEIPYNGTIHEVVQELLGSIRSACSYIGASELKYMSRCASLVKVNKIHSDF